MKLTDEERLPYTASATEQEIAAGALSVKKAPEHVRAFRSIDNLPQHFDLAAKDFLDLDEKTEAIDEAAHRRQDSLKRGWQPMSRAMFTATTLAGPAPASRPTILISYVKMSTPPWSAHPDEIEHPLRSSRRKRKWLASGPTRR